MFKKSLLFIAALSVFFLGVAGLTAVNAQERVFLSIGTGTTGGSYYPIGGAMAKIWSDKIPNVRASVQSTGGTIQNIQLMADKQTEAGFTDTKYVLAFQGKGPFAGKPQPWLRGLVPLYPEPTNIVVTKDSGIKSLRDLRGKRISIGAVGSGTEATSRELFTVLGMDVEKDLKPFMLGTGETASALKDKRIDAAILVGSLGMSSVVEITSLNLVDFLEVDDAMFQSIFRVNDTWVQFTIPANYYQHQSRPVKTYASFNILSVRDDLPAALAYLMTKTLFESKADLLAVRPTMENMTLENVHKIAIPLHPGAIRYYREMGVKF
ncbi:MAG: TAXI family TRAP transporter solute-binding subunit [Smithellaceae bacterium]|nr:TAXI family TRAP transporter solute-binding subunit [Smithellaceae bacterium]